MILNRNAFLTTSLLSILLAGLFLAAGPARAQSNSRCEGFGTFESLSLTNWESGLGSWSVGTHDVVDPDSFDTPDWSIATDLPGNRAGQAAFVPNLDIGDCDTDVESGVLNLDSPVIRIPQDVEVPRISIDHWFNTELYYDGGNLKVSVNGGDFLLLEDKVIERASYTELLDVVENSNPMAGDPAFTGTWNDQPDGSWVQTWVNLTGIARPGDDVVLRFDFGVDGCDGAVGWYVDEVEFYSCSEEVPPGNCGNSVLDEGEQCDDGNIFGGDGCSTTCQVESGWECTDDTPPATIADPGFEAGTPNPAWDEVSTNFQGSPICDVANCFTGGGTGPSEGLFWAWLGGVLPGAESSVSQTVVIPSGANELTFDLEVPACDSPSDFFEVRIDSQQVFRIDGNSNLCGVTGYKKQSVDIGDYNDDGQHELEFYARTFAEFGGVSSFFVDAVSLPGPPSVCTRIGPSLTLVKQVVNDDGGTADPSDWILSANGPTPFSGNGPSISSGDGFAAGTYNLSEGGGPDGYEASGWSCQGGTQTDSDTIVLGTQDGATCTITNDDIDATSLTLVKEVVNDDGGTAGPSAWVLRASGPESFSGNGPAVSSGAGLTPGTYDLSETNGPSGYLAGAWDCSGGTQVDDDTVTLVKGDVVTCTITNNDIDMSFTINAGHSGAWFNPDTSGQGQFIDVEPADQFMFLSWFTYTDVESDDPFEQRWLTAQGNYSGNVATLELFETLGGKFDGPQAATTTKVGEVTLEFFDCELGEMAYSIDTEGLQGTVPLQRVIPGSGEVCDNLASITTEAVDINAGMDGSWFDPNTSGQGFFIDADPDPEGQNFIFVSWFTYGDATASGQRWLTAQGGFTGSMADIELFETTGGSFDDDLPPSTVKVGTLSLDFTDCSNAVFSYALTDEALTNSIDVTRVIPGGSALCEDLAGIE
jgi:cysteine-rich repeat protein